MNLKNLFYAVLCVGCTLVLASCEKEDSLDVKNTFNVDGFDSDRLLVIPTFYMEMALSDDADAETEYGVCVYVMDYYNPGEDGQNFVFAGEAGDEDVTDSKMKPFRLTDSPKSLDFDVEQVYYWDNEGSQGLGLYDPNGVYYSEAPDYANLSSKPIFTFTIDSKGNFAFKTTSCKMNTFDDDGNVIAKDVKVDVAFSSQFTEWKAEEEEGAYFAYGEAYLLLEKNNGQWTCKPLENDVDELSARAKKHFNHLKK